LSRAPNSTPPSGSAVGDDDAPKSAVKAGGWLVFGSTPSVAPGRQSAHHDEVLGAARAGDRFTHRTHAPGAVLTALDGCDTQVDVGREPAVEAHFAQAVRVAVGARHETHEAEIDGLRSL
jgi:hypothetical protein